MDGLGNLNQVNGNLQINNNTALKNINGLDNLTQVDGNLSIFGNVALTNVGGFGSLTQVSGNLWIRFNGIFENTKKSELGNLTDSSLVIFGNSVLHIIMGFPSLKSVGQNNMTEGVANGLVIAFNPKLAVVSAFSTLAKVGGDLIILDNPVLKHIVLRSLSYVSSLTRITSNGARIENFTITNSLPDIEAGCRQKAQEFQHLKDTSLEKPAFVTSLKKDVCKVEKLVPTLVGFGIIGVLVLASLSLVCCLGLNFRSYSRERISLEKAKAMFASNLLSLADVLSDVGFIITVFILWDSKIKPGIKGEVVVEGEDHIGLFLIGVLSIIVLLTSQLFTIVSVYFGLMRKGIREELDVDSTGWSLMEQLKHDGQMKLCDWLLLFPGLLFLDAGVIKYLPWGESLINNSNKVAGIDDFPHKYFARVAFIAGILEDLPQMALQIAFTYVIEEDDGWAITGAMASLTLTVIDSMVKFVFPLLMKYMIPKETHLRRMRAMERRCNYCGGCYLHETDRLNLRKLSN